MNVIFSNNKWILYWKDKTSLVVVIESRSGLGRATARIAGSPVTYEGLGSGATREPQIQYKNGDMVPSYIRSKVTQALRTGKRFR